MSIIIRPPQPEDYEAAASIHNAQNEPHFYTTAEKLQRQDRAGIVNDPHYRRYIAEADGEVVATGYLRHDWGGAKVPGRYWTGLYVREDYRHTGADTQMLRHALESLQDTQEVWSVIREDFVPMAGFLEAEGFEEKFRTWGGDLNLKQFDASRFRNLFADLEASGIQIARFLDLDDPQRDAKVLALQEEARDDMLAYEPVAPSDFGDFRGSDVLRHSYLVALQGDAYIGIASLLHGEGETVLSGLTGVTRAYRDRGIGTALKVRTAEIAKMEGYSYLNSGGAGTQTPILSVNRKLGFDIEPAWLTFASQR